MWDTETAKCVKELEVAIGSDVLPVTLFEALFMKNEITRRCMYANNLPGFTIRPSLAFQLSNRCLESVDGTRSLWNRHRKINF